MSFREYIRAFRRSWYVVVVLALLGTLAGGAHAELTKPTYEASTTVYIASDSASIADLTNGTAYTQQVVKSYANLVSTSYVLDPAIAALGLHENAHTLSKDLSTTVPVGTSLLQISVRGPNPDEAARIVDQVAQTLIERAGSLAPMAASSRWSTRTPPPVKLTQVEQVEVPTEPVRPIKPLEWALGVLVGLLAGAIAAVLRDRLDTRVRSKQQVEALTSRPVLGSIPAQKSKSRRDLVVRTAPRSTAAEAYRSLRTNLQYLDLKGDGHGVVMTSSVEGEGKTTTTANLAVALAELGQRVCIVDADLRRPRVAELLGIEGAVGLTEVLVGRARLVDAMQLWGSSHPIAVLPAGRIPPNPSELLGGTAMERLLQKLGTQFDAVLIDAPPLLPVTDAAILSGIASGTLVVCSPSQARRGQLKAALDSLERAGARLLGIVLNKVPSRGPDAASYGRYGYGSSYVSRVENDLEAELAVIAAATTER